MNTVFEWLQEHPDVYLRMEGRYNGSPNVMRIIMEHKKHVICKAGQIVTDLMLEKLDRAQLQMLLDDMYRIIAKDVKIIEGR